MSEQTIEHKAFFGDKQRTFKLTVPMIIELERTTGKGIGSLCKRIFANEYGMAEISEIVRCSLIGGGEDPQTADSLVKTYVHNRPIAASIAVAVAILNAAFFGNDPLIENSKELTA